MTLGMAESDLGVGNRLTLLDDELHKNLGGRFNCRGGLLPDPARCVRRLHGGNGDRHR